MMRSRGLSQVMVLLLTLVSQGRLTQSADCPTNCFDCDGKGICINCNSGWYGEDCSKQCRNTCPGGCDKIGHCNTCQTGKYGDYCTEECPSNCKVSQCHIKTGHCEGGCKAGFHGDSCNLTCGNCSTRACSQQTGLCDDCPCGWTGDRCHIVCDQASASCKVCGGDGRTTSTSTSTSTSTTSRMWTTTATTASVTSSSGVTSGYNSVAAISIGVFLLLVILLTATGCIIAYWKHWFCFKEKRKPEPAVEPMYNSDPFGSPTISRAHSSFIRQDPMAMENEDE
ncbi:cell death abnormality protein 1-like [Haliotis rufescens]|uniref:cell death abnormality protein 1-like n=1 Tax=Haliotis rufescens TaxID=6454 RepID=UPI00201E9174|nr:cell death abnormality protein 1-like [Haliotis rufescens]XP_048255961.1 cell death abnormality protein 1-like [Haliotis rufescens]XP_048255962.1 cell death abnormality protein 1-like [Haliotis rufescens]